MKSYAFTDCPWCYGDGCNQCAIERKKATKEAVEPIFTTKLDSPEEIELAKSVIGREAIEKAFGKNGGGIKEIERNAALANFKRVLRKQNKS